MAAPPLSMSWQNALTLHMSEWQALGKGHATSMQANRPLSQAAASWQGAAVVPLQSRRHSQTTVEAVAVWFGRGSIRDEATVLAILAVGWTSPNGNASGKSMST